MRCKIDSSNNCGAFGGARSTLVGLIVLILGAAVPLLGADQCDGASLVLKDRFRITVQWEDFEGVVGDGLVRGYEESGAWSSSEWYFFRRSNWELTVKVADGCKVNGHYWVYAGGATDVGWTVTVTDTETGFIYQNGSDLFTTEDVADNSAIPCDETVQLLSNPVLLQTGGP